MQRIGYYDVGIFLSMSGTECWLIKLLPYGLFYDDNSLFNLDDCYEKSINYLNTTSKVVLEYILYILLKVKLALNEGTTLIISRKEKPKYIKIPTQSAHNGSTHIEIEK